jgi:hypothetical protein
MTRHEIVTEARHAADCFCGARRDQLCNCLPGAVHLARVARAHFDADDKGITQADFASVIADADVFTGMTLVLDPAVAA